MSSLYLETSALLAWMFSESRASDVESLLDSTDQIFTSVLTAMETHRAIARAHTLKLITSVERIKLLGLFASARANWYHVEITKNIRVGVGDTYPCEPIRTLDAIHLSTAVAVLAAYPDLKMLSFDNRIVENCQAMGMGLFSF